jgi:hypothetical protein
MSEPKTQFVLKGFSQVMGARIFEFEGVEADRTRTIFTVQADLAMSRRYGIALQELPLLCRTVLECGHEGGELRAFAYTEEAMRRHHEDAVARAELAKQRKPPRRPAPERPAETEWGMPPRY